MSSSSVAIRYIKSNPFLEDYLQQGLVNYSAVARLIHRKNPGTSEAAIGMSLRRFAQRKKGQKKIESAIRKLINDARIKIENKTSVMILKRPADYAVLNQSLTQIRSHQGECTMIEGSEAVTLIFSTRLTYLVMARLEPYLIRTKSDLARIVLTIDERLEETPGVVSHVYGQLSKAGINIHEEMSCWHDIMMVIDEKDVGRAMAILTGIESQSGEGKRGRSS